jgi:hypothetical protein
MEEYFTSRIDGSLKFKSDFEKVGDFYKEKKQNLDDFNNQLKSSLSSIVYYGSDFRSDTNLVHEKLKEIWNLDHQLLREIVNYFESFDQTNAFLEILDGSDDINSAWNEFVDKYNWSEIENPFI